MNKSKHRNTRSYACTTMIVGKDATADGSVIVAHSDDDVSDARLIHVPRRPIAKGAMRNVYYDDCSLGSYKGYNCNDIRRYIGKDRGPGYDTIEKDKADYRNRYHLNPQLCYNSRPIGQIPEDDSMKETFAYFDGSYGVMNERNLMIGECTCGARVQPYPDPVKRLFYSAELSRVALERCTKARDAVLLMGSLILQYGYYGTGETLLVGDADEAWVMEMCGYDMDGTDGLWVARRVPDDEFFVAANEFRIRDIFINANDERSANLSNGRYFKSAVAAGAKAEDADVLYSANLFKVCEDKGWIEKGAEMLDWLPAVSYGEYSHPYYSLRRVWRAFSKVAPRVFLPAKVTDGYTRAYPFSLKPEKKLSVLDVAAVYRDHYEGTAFDMTVGPAAGPFRNPVRYEGNPDQGDSFNLNTYKLNGAWERPISIYRCGMFWINQAKAFKDRTIGVSWNACDRPAANCLMPLFTQMETLPSKLQTMNVLEFEFNGPSAWWAFNFVANLSNLNYEYMMKEVTAVQKEMEARAEAMVNHAMRSQDTSELSSLCAGHVENVMNQWWQLATRLIVKFNDGCVTTGPNSIMQPIDYPHEWLQRAGYCNGPTTY
ncbi:MAG: C69 family dipeptidase [Deltaproteobacteria bacterium]|nr:C69 family dipeptidase [Deltaproteobacteria bacterium]